MRMSKVRTVPSTLPAIISVFVRITDITLSWNESTIWHNSTLDRRIRTKASDRNRDEQTRSNWDRFLYLNRLGALRPTIERAHRPVVAGRDHDRVVLIKLHRVNLKSTKGRIIYGDGILIYLAQVIKRPIEAPLVRSSFLRSNHVYTNFNWVKWNEN